MKRSKRNNSKKIEKNKVDTNDHDKLIDKNYNSSVIHQNMLLKEFSIEDQKNYFDFEKFLKKPEYNLFPSAKTSNTSNINSNDAVYYY